MREKPTQEAEIELQTEMKHTRQNRFFWIFYCVYGFLILFFAGYRFLGDIAVNEKIAIGSFAVPVLWFGPVFLRKNYARVAATWAMALIAFLWCLYIYISILKYVFMSTNRAEGPNWGDSPVAFLGIWAFEIVFIIMPLTILLLSGIGPLIRCFKEAKPVAVTANSKEQEDACQR